MIIADLARVKTQIESLLPTKPARVKLAAQDLLNALKCVEPCVAKKTQLESGVFLQFTDNQLILVGHSSHTWGKTRLPVKNARASSITVEYMGLKRAVIAASQDEVEIGIDGDRLLINDEQLPGLDPLPDMPEAARDCPLTVKTERLIESLKVCNSLIQWASKQQYSEQPPPTFWGIKLEIHSKDLFGGILKARALHKSQIAESDAPFVGSGTTHTQQGIIYPEVLSVLNKSKFNTLEDSVSVALTPRHLGLRIGELEIVSEFIPGNHPSVTGLKFDRSAVKFSVEKHLLLKALREIDAIPDEGYSMSRITAENSQLTIEVLTVKEHKTFAVPISADVKIKEAFLDWEQMLLAVVALDCNAPKVKLSVSTSELPSFIETQKGFWATMPFKRESWNRAKAELAEDRAQAHWLSRVRDAIAPLEILLKK